MNDFVCNHGHRHASRALAIRCNEQTTHYEQAPGRPAACGSNLLGEVLSNVNPTLVTCQRCRKTLAWSEALARMTRPSARKA